MMTDEENFIYSLKEMEWVKEDINGSGRIDLKKCSPYEDLAKDRLE